MDVTAITALCSILSLVQSQGYPNIQDTKYVQDGRTVTFSWTLHKVVSAEFSVSGPSTSSSIFHVIYGRQPTLVNDTYKNRIHNVSYLRGPDRVFSFQLSDVSMSDGGTYSVFAASRNTPGQELDRSQLVVARVLPPYIVTTDTAPYRNSASLSCYSFTVLSGEGSLTTVLTWQKNNVQLSSGSAYSIRSYDGTWYNWEYYHVSTLTIYDVSLGDRYSCQATLDQLMVNVTSEDLTLGRNLAMSYDLSNTVMKETDNTTVIWNLPFRDSDFYVSRDSGDRILHVNATMIYIMDMYWSRIRISDVTTTSSRSLVVQFTLYNVTSSDAGKLDCRVYDREWYILPEWHHLLTIARKPEDPLIYSSGSVIPGKPLVLICSTLSLSLPVDHGLRMSYTWRRNKQQLGHTGKYHYEGSSLTFTNEEDYSGRYSCRAREWEMDSNWSAEYTVEETYSRNTMIIVILVSCLAVMLIVAIAVATYRHAYKALKESFRSPPLDVYITPVSDTGTSVEDAGPNIYEYVDVGTVVTTITRDPSLSDVNNSDQQQRQTDNGVPDNPDGGTRPADTGYVDVSESGFIFTDDSLMSQSHVCCSTIMNDKLPQTDTAGYVAWNEAEGVLIRPGINVPKYDSADMDFNELDFTSRTFTVIDKSSTSQSHDPCITSGERPQTDAKGYVAWNEDNGMLIGKQICGPNFVKVSDLKNTEELNVPPCSIKVIEDPPTSQAHTSQNISEETTHPQTDAMGYVAWNEAKGMLVGKQICGPNFVKVSDHKKTLKN